MPPRIPFASSSKSSRDSIWPGKVLCVGRNYRAHAEELGNPVPREPVLFLKPSTSLVPGGGRVVLPRGIGTIHHEVELAVVIGGPGVGEGVKDVPREKALDCVLGYAVMLDLTARELQSEAKSKGLPWSVSKGYDGFAPISNIVPVEKVQDPQTLNIRLEVNGEMRQHGNTRQMLFPIAELISRASKIMTLEEGDIIATGTPEGVGPVAPGDKVLACIEGVGELEVSFE